MILKYFMISPMTASYTLNLKYKSNDVNDSLDYIIYQVQIHINYQEIGRTKFVFGFCLLFINLLSH